MGKIADLLEKKALGTLSEAETKELDTLLKEAALATEKSEETTENSDEESVEVLAQKMADIMQASTKASDERFEKLMKTMEEKTAEPAKTTDGGFIVDKKLGKTHTVEDLGEIKIALPGRKQAGKEVTEISQKTVEFFAALYSGDHQKLQLLAESTNSGADGGYLVPDEFANVIIEDVRDLSIMRQLASVMTTQSDTVHIPNLVSRPKAAWRAEKAVKNTSTATFTENVLTPYSLAVIVGLSNELVADAKLGVGGSIVNYIAGLMSTSINEKEEEAFWVGSGSGQPSGIDSYTFARTYAADATDVSRADTLIKGYQTTPQGYRNKAVWVMNMGTLFEVGRLKDSQNRYLLSDLAGSPTQTIKGRPVYESNYLPGGKIFFGDFSYYQIVDREGISVRVSDEATVASQSAFEQNLTYIRVEKRVDAELLLPAAVTELSGYGTP
jgi:HK97 family phage major capsid protein